MLTTKNIGLHTLYQRYDTKTIILNELYECLFFPNKSLNYHDITFAMLPLDVVLHTKTRNGSTQMSD